MVAAESPVKDTIRGWFPLIVVGSEESWSAPVSCLNVALIKQPQNLHICAKKNDVLTYRYSLQPPVLCFQLVIAC